MDRKGYSNTMKMEENRERVLQRNIQQDVNEMLYEIGIKDTELEVNITSMIVDKWKKQRGLD